MTRLKLSTGAAHWAATFLNNTNCKLCDLFYSGSLALKLRSAVVVPQQEEGENGIHYRDRVEAYLDQPFGGEDGIEVSDNERDFMRALLRKRGEAEQLPGNYHVAELARAFDLDKP